MLPAGPSVVDVMANAAFYYGVVRGLVESDRPLWSRMSFDAARENLAAGAHWGMQAQLYWPDVGWVRPDQPATPAPRGGQPLQAAQVVRRFRSAASRDAGRLAGYLAAASRR